MPANRNPQCSRPAVAKSEECMIRKMLFAAIATLAVGFGTLAAASAAYVGDGSNLDGQSSVMLYGSGN
jgi:hypothetical protein